MKNAAKIIEKRFFFLILLSLFLFSCTNSSGTPEPIENLTNAHTRVVWVQEQGKGADSFAFGENFKLMGYDSRDGKKERPLLKEVQNFYKPILTPDGEQVVVSSRSRHEIYLVDFQKGKKKTLGKGVAVEVWDDPETGVTWVYALAGDGPENQYFTTHPLIRFPLNNPKKREDVWSKSHLSWSNFDLSRDGKFAGGLFPWPASGILIFQENTWKKYGQGCWTALSPDNSAILWTFDGLHRNLNFVNPFSSEVWTTSINKAEGINGYEVYHPRWSNHVRFLTMTGPYVEGEGGNKITGGGQKVEIYVGRFSQDLKQVEQWYQVTHNDRADFFPDVWIAGGRESNFGDQDLVKSARIQEKDLEWPVNRDSLLFLWQDVLAENKSGDAGLLGFRQFTVSPVQRAHYNRFLEMDLNHGGFIAAPLDDKTAAAVRKSGGAGIEFLYTPLSVADDAEGVVLKFGDIAAGVVLEVAQTGEEIAVSVVNGEKTVGKLRMESLLHAGRPEHFYLSLHDKKLQLHVNGILVKEVTLTQDIIPLLKDPQLTFGNISANENGLDAAISHVALYAESAPQKSITENAQLVTGELEARKEIESLTVTGTLIETSNVPAPDSLGAYTRALVVNRYKIEDIKNGTYPENEILVAQWAVMDRKIMPETKSYEEGKRLELQVEKFDLHPELEGERLMMDMFDPDLELYYQIRP